MSSMGENVHDRISRLPEEIVSQILSLMPTKYAVRTSILSKRWRYSWMLITNLDFDDNGLDSFSKFVDRVLKLCKSSRVKLFRLNSSKTHPESSVSSWIDEAVRLNVCELDIQVTKFKFPLSVLACKTLTKIRLNCDTYDQSVWYPSLVYFPFVKILDITICNPSVNLFMLVNGCPRLETLSLEVKCTASEMGHDLSHTFPKPVDYIFNIPSLKQLKLTLLKRKYFINKVVLHVPNLEYLYVGGVLSSTFVMEDVSSLVEACVSFSDIISVPGIASRNLWVELVRGLSGVKSLSVQNIPSTIYLPRFPNMKHLKLKSYWTSGPVLQFLESSPELEHLYIEKLQESAWIEPKLVPACMITNLKTIRFSISPWGKCDSLFLEYTVGNSKVLKTVTITSEFSSNIDKEKQLFAKLLNFPRASGCCEIHLH